MTPETARTFGHGISWKHGMAIPRHTPNPAMWRGRYLSVEVIQIIDTAVIAKGHSHPESREMVRCPVRHHATIPPRKQGANFKISNLSPNCGWMIANGRDISQRAARSFIGRFRRSRNRTGKATYISISSGKDQRGVRMGGNTGCFV